MNLSAALDQFEDICLTALSNATFFDKKENASKSLRGRLKRCHISKAGKQTWGADTGPQ